MTNKAGDDPDYLKWATERQLERIDASEGHVQDLRKRATLMTGAVAALASYALPELDPPNLLELVVLALSVLVTGGLWWKALQVGMSEDYDPDQFTDELDEYTTAEFLNPVLLHVSVVAKAAQKQVTKTGTRCARTLLAGAVSVVAIMVILAFGVSANGRSDPHTQAPPGEAAEGRSQSTGHDPEAERHPGSDTKGELNGG